MKVKEKPIWTFKVSGTQQTNTRSTVRARDIEMVIDEPIERGGANLSPMPVETMMMGLVGTPTISRFTSTSSTISGLAPARMAVSGSFSSAR